MPDLIVRGVDEQRVRALKARAGAHGRSAEAEHREILKSALERPQRRSLSEIILAMPDVGLDSDFQRTPSKDAPRDVFD
jgi:plasmid stability protein